jgi:TatD DNase family protein
VIDSHCHLADDVFVEDVGAVIDRAREAGLTGALCILDAGTAPELERVPRLRELWPALRFSAGIHPQHAKDYAGRLDSVPDVVRRALGVSEDVRALGEIGLDYHYDFSPRDVQLEVFRAQVALACEVDLPIVVHTREADEDTVRVLREAGQGRVRGVFHCFTGNEALARAALDLGFFLSFSGIATFPRAEALRSVLRLAPPDRVLIETDSPYLAPPPYRGKRNEPAWVARVAETLAEALREPVEAFRARTAENFTRLFRP